MSKKLQILLVILLTVGSFFIGRQTINTSDVEEVVEQEEKTVEYLSHDAYKLLFTSIDYQETVTYVVGHKTPDADSVTSAIVMADLLNQLGINAEARIASDVNSETINAFNYFGLKTPEILQSGENQQLWLVDHSEAAQAVDGINKARIVGIVDHHGIGDLSNEELIVVRSGMYGSTTGEIYTLYKECGIEITQDIARLMIIGILSDTAYFKHDDNMLNREIYDELLKVANIDDVDKLITVMKEGKLDYASKTEEEIFDVDYKDYEESGVKYRIANIKVATVDNIEEMFNRMKKVALSEIEKSDCEYIFYYVYDFDYTKGYLGCVNKDQTKVNDFLTKVFGNQYEILDGYLVTEPSLNRKTEIAPRINEVLSK